MPTRGVIVSTPQTDPPRQGGFRRFFADPIRALFYDDLRDLPDLAVADHDPFVADPLPPLTAYLQRVRDIRDRIDELSRARAVDEGTPTVLDGEIENVMEVRHRSIRLKHCTRRIRIDYRAAELGAAIQSATDTISRVDQDISDIEEEIRRSDAQRATDARRNGRRYCGGRS